MNIQIRKIFGDAKLPQYATEGSAGMDLVADNFKKLYGFHVHNDFDMEEATQIDLFPRQRVLIGTGVAIAIPEGYELQVRPRSGMALKHGITVLNSPGTIDSDYRDEVGVILINNGTKAYKIKIGDKIAQGVVAAYEKVIWQEVSELNETSRKGGFGSTGTSSKQ